MHTSGEVDQGATTARPARRMPGLVGGKTPADVQAIAAWVADRELWFLAALVGVLIFRTALPASLPLLMIGGIPLFWICRKVARGYLTVHTPLDIPLLILLALLPISLLVSSDPEASLPLVYKTVVEVAVFYGIVNAIRSPRWLGALGPGLLVASICLAAFSLIGTKWTLGTMEKVLPLRDVYSILPRAILKVLNPDGYSPNLVGGTLAMLLPLALAYVLYGQRREHRILGIAAGASLGVTLLLVQSRGAWVGIGLAMLVLVCMRSRGWAVVGGLGVAGALLTLRQVGVHAVADYVSAGGTISSLDTRLEVWSRAVYMIQDFPYTGIGIGTFPKVVDALYPLFLSGPGTLVPHAHNIYLQAAVDFGLAGLVAFAGLWSAVLMVTFLTARRVPDSELYPLMAGLMGGFVAYLGHGLLDAVTALSFKTSIVLWILVGVSTAAWVVLRRPPPPLSVESH